MTTPPGPPDGSFLPPHRLVPPPGPVGGGGGPQPQQPAVGPPPPSGTGYYPQQSYYAPGWQPAGDGRPPRRRRRRTVVVALVVIIALFGVSILGAAAAGLRYVMDTRPLGEVEGPVTAAARRLDVGHCVEELPSDGQVRRVRVVPCGEPHEAEVVGALTLNEGAWPGQNAVERTAQAYCEMDRTQTESGFRPVVWQPSETGWGQGDRGVLCLAWSGGAQVTGSFTAGEDVTPN